MLHTTFRITDNELRDAQPALDWHGKITCIVDVVNGDIDRIQIIHRDRRTGISSSFSYRSKAVEELTFPALSSCGEDVDFNWRHDAVWIAGQVSIEVVNNSYTILKGE